LGECHPKKKPRASSVADTTHIFSLSVLAKKHVDRHKADTTAESIKSLESFRIAWVEEAQTLSQRSLSLLRPTIRTEGSQLWANWNPRRKSDAIDDFLRAKKPDKALVVQANWRDNPWFPGVLDEERRLDFEIYPERHAHIWEGDNARAF
jgi:phage terminase large subunit